MAITLQDLIAMRDAGWAVIAEAGGNSVTLRWTTRHITPEWVGSSYPYPTYKQHTFLTYTLRDGIVRGQILHGNARAPWVQRTDSWVSQRRALAIAQEAQARESTADHPDE